MYPNASGPHAARTSGEHRHPTHPAYAQPRATGPHQAPPRPQAPPAKPAGPKLVAAAVALAVLGGVGGWLAYDAPAENRYQTVSYAGDNPFTSPVGTDRPDVTAVAAGGEQSGETPGMYTQDPARPACDARSLVGQVTADPTKAAAWASVLGITAAGIPAFVDGLTPVTLRADTAVIDYGYRDGGFVPGPAVLAAGTAVFINSYGEPTVKCYSGNPLTRGESTAPNVAVVAPALRPIATNTFFNVVTGSVVTRPGKPDTTGKGPNPAPSIDLAAKAKDARLASDQARVLAGAATDQRVAAEKAVADDKTAATNAQIGLVGENVKLSQLEGTLNILRAVGSPAAIAKAEQDVADQKKVIEGAEKKLEEANDKVTQSQKDLDAAKAREDDLKKDAEAKDKDADDAEKKAGLPPQPQERFAGDAAKAGTTKQETGAGTKPEDTTVTKAGTDATTVDPATGKPVEDAPVVKKAPAAGTNTGVDPVDPPVVEPVPAEKVPGNTGVIVPPADETAGSTTGTSTGASSGTSSGTTSGTTSGSGSGDSASSGSGEGGNG